MNSTVIKMLIALLPTAPVVGEYIVDFEPTEIETTENESTETIEEIQERQTENYPKLYNVEETNIQVGDTFDPLLGVYAVDKNDGDVTDKITTSGEVDTETLGDYYVNYKVTNNSGGWYEMTRVIHVTENPSDEVKPTPKRSNKNTSSRVTFINIDDVEISTGTSFDPKNDVKIYDTDGQDITKDMVVEGEEVDTNTPGEYYIAYTVIDRFGKANAVARKVTVK